MNTQTFVKKQKEIQLQKLDIENIIKPFFTNKQIGEDHFRQLCKLCRLGHFEKPRYTGILWWEKCFCPRCDNRLFPVYYDIGYYEYKLIICDCNWMWCDYRLWY